MFSFLGGTIAVCKLQYQCRAFATDIAQNTAELYLKIQGGDKLPSTLVFTSSKIPNGPSAPGVESYLMSFAK